MYGNIYRWILSYLYNRRARVNVDETKSKTFILRHGVSQGRVLSPALFLLFIDDMISEFSNGVKAALYADDLVIWCKEEYATTATYRMQEAADKLNAWVEDWCVAINKEKSSTTPYTVLTKQKTVTIKLGGVGGTIETGSNGHLSWRHLWCSTDLETAHHQGRGEG